MWVEREQEEEEARIARAEGPRGQMNCPKARSAVPAKGLVVPRVLVEPLLVAVGKVARLEESIHHGQCQTEMEELTMLDEQQRTE
jgi:hypothetical protein